MTNNRWPKTLLANIAEVSFYIGINTSFHLPSVSDSTVHYYFIFYYGMAAAQGGRESSSAAIPIPIKHHFIFNCDCLPFIAAFIIFYFSHEP
jgi:hypothetical protein